MDSKICNITYEFRVFRARAETYALRLAGSEVTGVYGPLDYSEVLFHTLPDFQYEDQPDKVAWAKSNFCDFIPGVAECEEGMHWV